MKEKLNRKTPPPIHQVTSLTLATPSVSRLDNGIAVYATRLGTQKILKIELIIRAGRPEEKRRLASRMTARLLREGTQTYISAQIAEQLDFFAGTFAANAGMDTVNISLHCMTKHLPDLLPLVAEMIVAPTFPERELSIVVDNKIQQLTVELSKNDVVAYRKITALIFGENTAYGYNSVANDYRTITTADCRAFHTDYYTADRMSLFISGYFDDATLQLLNKYLGQIPQKNTQMPKITPLSISTQNQPQKFRIPHPDSLQTAIRVGRRFGNRHHADYNAFFMLNTIFGGYFGSRLMSNIREDKGYTYNIHSSVDTMHHDGYFYIGSEVGNDVVDKTLTEIYKEMEIMTNDLVSEKELTMVKNYLLGNMLNMVDGPFAIGDVVRTFITEGLPFEAWETFVDKIRTIEATEIRDLAQQYFKKEDFFEVIVGV
ncbi:MAG: pitrilysin family protein [Saprospiraceae bacterium]|nr:pitrilysin family protein [Saprospiraceae bacterium]